METKVNVGNESDMGTDGNVRNKGNVQGDNKVEKEAQSFYLSNYEPNNGDFIRSRFSKDDNVVNRMSGM